MSALAKPVLRGHIKRRGIKGVIGALCFGLVNASLFHFCVAVPRKAAQEEYIRNYDGEAHFKELLKYNYLYYSTLLKELGGE